MRTASRSISRLAIASLFAVSCAAVAVLPSPAEADSGRGWKSNDHRHRSSPHFDKRHFDNRHHGKRHYDKHAARDWRHHDRRHQARNHWHGRPRAHHDHHPYRAAVGLALLLPLLAPPPPPVIVQRQVFVSPPHYGVTEHGPY